MLQLLVGQLLPYGNVILPFLQELVNLGIVAQKFC